MKKVDIEARVAYLEFVHDQLMTEIHDIDCLLRQIGFPKGLESAKSVAEEMLNELNKEQ